MDRDRVMRIVIGYLPGVDRLPAQIRRLNLMKRTAFVLDTHRPGDSDLYFDCELYSELVAAVGRVVDADTMTAILPTGTTVDVPSNSETHRRLAEIPEIQRQPLLNVMCRRKGSIEAVVESEPWAQVGGPKPYHDSYTIPVFCHRDISEILVAEARSICARLGAVVGEVIRGTDVPTRPGFLASLRSKLGLGR